MSSSALEEKYYRQFPPKSLAKRLLISARDRVYSDFMAHMHPSPSDQILDIGVSDFPHDGANVLERAYPHQRNITACGLNSGTQFKNTFPLVHYLQIEPNARLPFDDDTFEIAMSNAVLEHLGSFKNQALFVREICRVARRVFICVPNRFFPIEHHSVLPVVHFQDTMFKIACRLTGKTEWASEDNLILMTRKRLWQLAVPIDHETAAVGYTGLRLGPFSSNLYLAFHETARR